MTYEMVERSVTIKGQDDKWTVSYIVYIHDYPRKASPYTAEEFNCVCDSKDKAMWIAEIIGSAKETNIKYIPTIISKV